MTTAQGLDYDRLSQVQLAAICGRPVSFIRNNPSLFHRHPDGTYDLRALIQSATTSPGELPAELRERAAQAIEAASFDTHWCAAGLAEVNREIIACGAGIEFLQSLADACERQATIQIWKPPGKDREM